MGLDFVFPLIGLWKVGRMESDLNVSLQYIVFLNSPPLLCPADSHRWTEKSETDEYNADLH